MGLEYIHYRGLVHMELSLDTIMVRVSVEFSDKTNIHQTEAFGVH